MLTARQAELLRFIDRYNREFGCSPTYRDMAIAMRVRSRGTMVAMVNRLCDRDCLRKIHGRKRAVAIIADKLRITINGRIVDMRAVPFVEVSP